MRQFAFYCTKTLRKTFNPVRKKDNFLVFGSPKIENNEIQEVVDTLKSTWLGTGPKVNLFEKEFNQYKGGEYYPVAVSSCTAALHLSLVASGVTKGDEFITTPLTFCATLNAIIHAGGVPVLADIDPVTYNIDPAEIEKKVTEKTKAIVLVHLNGRCCEMEKIKMIAENHNLKIIEDCAHAIESEHKGKKAGTFGDFSCFSFYATKNLTTAEGGMILAKSEEDANRLKTLALHGMSNDAWKRYSDEGYKHYLVTECGFKYNMTDLQAAIGIHQLRRIEENWERRKKIWDFYQNSFSSFAVRTPAEVPNGDKHGYHIFNILVDDKVCGINRDQFLNEMTRHNIGVGVHYLSIPEHPFYQNHLDWNADDYPLAKAVGRQTVSLPLSAKLSDKDIEDVIKAVSQILA